MFNEFEGTKGEREAKLQERLRILKRARKDGFFDEEGTEPVDVVGNGVNLCDLDPSLAFTGEAPEPKPSTFKRPMGVIRSENKSRCWMCRGVGDWIMYGDELRCCPACGGTGRGLEVEGDIEWQKRAREAARRMCPACGGFGSQAEHPPFDDCSECDGTGERGLV